MWSFPDETGRTANEISWQLDGLADRTQYLRAMLEVLERTIPSDAIGWNSVDQVRRTAVVFGNPAERYQDNEIPAEVLGTVDDHPMIQSYATEWLTTRRIPRPRRLSDVVSRRELRRTRAYAELLGPLHADRQLTVLTSQTSPGVGTCWTFTVDHGDFSDGVVELATRLQPLLVSLERAQSSLVAHGRVTLAVDHDRDHALTRREVEVMSLVAKGLTASAIASVLRISTPTVRKHLENSYRKLGHSDRLLAVRRAQDDGLIPR